MPLPTIFEGHPGFGADINVALAMVVFKDGTIIALGDNSVYNDGTVRLGIGTTSPQVNLQVSSTNPKAYWTESDQGADGKTWGLSVSGGTMFWFARNDADSAGQNFMRITRSGTTVLVTAFENGQVAIGTTTPNAAAKLEVSSTTQGLLLPRMTTTQRDAISSPPEGLLIYNTTVGLVQVRSSLLGGSWQSL